LNPRLKIFNLLAQYLCNLVSLDLRHRYSLLPSSKKIFSVSEPTSSN
jgi:hypothetical protein